MEYSILKIVVLIVVIIIIPSISPTPIDESVLSNQQIAELQYQSQLNIWIDQLIQKESGGDPNALLAVDLNGLSSNGCLQYQMPTWLEMGETYGIDTTPENIFDCR